MALLLLALITTLIDTHREAVLIWICMQTCCCIFGKLNFTERTMLNYWLLCSCCCCCCWRVIWHQATVLDDCSKQIYLNVLSNLMIMSEYCYIVRANDWANDFFFSTSGRWNVDLCFVVVERWSLQLPPTFHFRIKGKIILFQLKVVRVLFRLWTRFEENINSWFCSQ